MSGSAKSTVKTLYFSERLTAAIRQIADFPLTVVEAPLGYGKSTAVREQLRNFGKTVLWQRIDSDSPGEFWRGFCNLFRDYDEILVEHLLQINLPGDAASRGIALGLLARLKLDPDTIIVLDDYHLADCSEINSWLEFLVLNDVIDPVRLIWIIRFGQLGKLDGNPAFGI